MCQHQHELFVQNFGLLNLNSTIITRIRFAMNTSDVLPIPCPAMPDLPSGPSCNEDAPNDGPAPCAFKISVAHVGGGMGAEEPITPNVGVGVRRSNGSSVSFSELQELSSFWRWRLRTSRISPSRPSNGAQICCNQRTEIELTVLHIISRSC